VISWLEKSDSCTKTIICSFDGISLDSSNLLISNYNSMCNDSKESIKMNTKITIVIVGLHFDNISIFKLRLFWVFCGFAFEW